jgi:hypothetical protein
LHQGRDFRAHDLGLRLTDVEPGQLRVILDLAPANKLFEAQRQGHEARDAWHPPRRDFRRGFNRTCGYLAALAYPAPEGNLADNCLR